MSFLTYYNFNNLKKFNKKKAAKGSSGAVCTDNCQCREDYNLVCRTYIAPTANTYSCYPNFANQQCLCPDPHNTYFSTNNLCGLFL